MSYATMIAGHGATAHWKCDDAISGATTIVDSISGLNGTSSSTGVSRQARTWGGESGYCLQFSSATYGYVSVPDNAAWDCTEGSVEAWFRTSTTGVYQDIMRRDATTRSFAFRVTNGNKLQFLVIFGGNPSVTSSASVTDDAWHHAAATWKVSGGNTTIELFLDGSSLGTATATGTMPTSSEALFIGTYNTVSELWNGYLDEVAFYNGHALTSTEVSAHYSYTSGPSIPVLMNLYRQFRA